MSDVSLLNVNRYFPLFSIKKREEIVDTEYAWSAPTEDISRFGGLCGDLDLIDTPLEFALLSYYSRPIINNRPVQANAVLPANNPKLADLKLGAAVFQDMQILRFLGNTAAVGRHEGMLKFITDRGNATRAEVECFYRRGISALVSEIVDEEFNKSGQDGIIPARVYADWERQGRVKDSSGKAVNGIALIKETLTNFFLNPTETNYVRVRGIIARILADESVHNRFGATVETAWTNTITSLSPELQSRLMRDFNRAADTYAAARQPNDPAFRIFEIPYNR